MRSDDGVWIFPEAIQDRFSGRVGVLSTSWSTDRLDLSHATYAWGDNWSERIDGETMRWALARGYFVVVARPSVERGRATEAVPARGRSTLVGQTETEV